jgi:hypothetical protein
MDKEKCLVCGKPMGNSLSTVAFFKYVENAPIWFPVHNHCKQGCKGKTFDWAMMRHKELNSGLKIKGDC